MGIREEAAKALEEEKNIQVARKKKFLEKILGREAKSIDGYHFEIDDLVFSCTCVFEDGAGGHIFLAERCPKCSKLMDFSSHHSWDGRSNREQEEITSLKRLGDVLSWSYTQETMNKQECWACWRDRMEGKNTKTKKKSWWKI